MDKRIVFAAACAALTACAGMPNMDAGISRQELEGKGGKRLAASELRQAIAGTLISGRTHSGRAFWEWNLGADGGVNGTVSWQHGTFPQVGKRHVAEDGKFCYEVAGQGGPESGGQIGGCQQWYKLGADFYAVEGTHAMKRDVTRI